MDKVAVVILNYNGSNFLQKFLPTLITHSSEASIIVADNCSTDDSLQVLKSFDQVKTIVLKENHGYAGGYNEALKHVSAKYYALVNSDIEVSHNWLTPLINFLDHNTDYAAVQPKILDFHQKDQFEYAGAAGGYLDPFGYPYCRGRIFDTLEKDSGQYDDSLDVFWTTGACFIIRSNIFHDLEGFPADFFAHMEEIDLCWRLWNSNHKLACIPDSHVYHVGGGTLDKTSPKKTYLNFRNNIRLLVRNLPKWQLLFVLPIRILLDWTAAFMFWKNQSFDHFKAIPKAHQDALMKLFEDLENQKRGKIKSFQKRGFLLIKYYLLNKKRYSQL